jgi:hypothetical protein
MNTTTTFAFNLPNTLCPITERTSAGRDLGEALDAWLADDFAHEDYLHVHSWSDDGEEIVR